MTEAETTARAETAMTETAVVDTKKAMETAATEREVEDTRAVITSATIAAEAEVPRGAAPREEEIEVPAPAGPDRPSSILPHSHIYNAYQHINI